MKNELETKKQTKRKSFKEKYLLLWLFSAVVGNFIQVEYAEGSTA